MTQNNAKLWKSRRLGAVAERFNAMRRHGGVHSLGCPSAGSNPASPDFNNEETRMSTFEATFINTVTKEECRVLCMDDFFGRHEYGYRFLSGEEVLTYEQMVKEGWERHDTRV